MAVESTQNTGASTTENPSFRNPQLECDLVMKGGVTSGIVYPQAILELAIKYRFRSIGGTSAGAIAAAMTAAAEYGRHTGGFEKLKAITDELAKPHGLLGLFQPQPSTRPLFDVLLGYLKLHETGPDSRAAVARGTWSAFSSFGGVAARASVPRTKSWSITGFVLGFLIAFAMALLFAAIHLAAGLPVPYGVLWKFVLLVGLALALAAFWLGRRVGAGYTLFQVATKSVPENAYGMCSGMGDSGTGESLTPWLHQTINSLAGFSATDAPLTFAQLQTPAQGSSIALRMITSNLSHNRPYELPLSQRVWIAKTEEFSRLFPARVMQYLQDHAYDSTATILPEGYFYLPQSDDLPVVVAVRMSLSFPLLISAVPLYTVKRSAFANSPRNEDNAIEVTPADLQRNWFSDGGICSNFPIHFFDTWLPQRPTFGIKLTAFPEGAFDPTSGNLYPDYLGQMRQPDRADQSEAGEVEDEIAPAGNTANQAAQPVDPIYLSPANRAPAPEWTPIEDPAEIGDDGTRPNLLRFLWNIFATAQNYRDNMQSDLPSYRERIVQIRLKESEGGLNLAMSPDTVAAIMQKGKLAGRRLLKRFSFEQHQWVRFLTVAARIEDAADEMNQSLASKKFDPTTLLSRQRGMPPFPYERPRNAWVSTTVTRLRTAAIFIRGWSGKHFRNRAPEPEPTLQVTPRL